MAAAKKVTKVTANSKQVNPATKAKVAPKTTKKPVKAKAKTKPKKEEVKEEKKPMSLKTKIGLGLAAAGAIVASVLHVKSKNAAWENGYIEGSKAAQGQIPEKSETTDNAEQQ